MIQKALVAASFALLMSTSYASAQCADCAIYPDRDHLNNGVQVPAAKMGLMGTNGAPVTNQNNGLGGARAQYTQEPGAPTTRRAKSRHSKSN